MTPQSGWRRRHLAIWGLLAALVTVWQGPKVVALLQPEAGTVPDFFQEWSSARAFFDGAPLYGSLPKAARHYLSVEVPATDIQAEYNLHPPTSVLLTLPLGLLEFRDACLLWNLLSLLALILTVWLVWQGREPRPPAWVLLPVGVYLLSCFPLQVHLYWVQLNLILGLLLAGAWTADRHDHPAWAGILTALATALKMFPGFVFLYFLARQRWRALLWGGVSLGVLNAISLLLFGWQAFDDYVHRATREVTPIFISLWFNESLPGFWAKLLGGGRDYGTVLWHRPDLSRAATLASFVLLTLVTGAFVWKARTQAARDFAFGAVLVAMLLASPFTWGHTLMLLVLPLLLLWLDAERSRTTQAVLVLVLALLWMDQVVFWKLFLNADFSNWRHLTPEPWQTLTVLSYRTYVLIALWVILLRECHSPLSPVGATQPPPRNGEGRKTGEGSLIDFAPLSAEGC